MINGIRLKICGLTSFADAGAASAIGADYLGFIFYPPSPRHITSGQYRDMTPHLPAQARIAVCVEPTDAELAELAGLNFDFFQIHFSATTAPQQIVAWSQAVSPARLWLAPKLPLKRDVDAAWLPLADTFLLDTFHSEKFGGTGMTGDWEKFHRHAAAHPDKLWVLSGGLKPTNIAKAVDATGASMVDVNSGVESSPGVKDQAKLEAIAEALRGI